MSEQEPQLFGIWNETRDRWARITPPCALQLKYGQEGHKYFGGYEMLFLPEQEAKIWFAELDNYNFHFEIRPKGYISPDMEQKAERKRREAHAAKYF